MFKQANQRGHGADNSEARKGASVGIARYYHIWEGELDSPTCRLLWLAGGLTHTWTGKLVRLAATTAEARTASKVNGLTPARSGW